MDRGRVAVGDGAPLILDGVCDAISMSPALTVVARAHEPDALIATAVSQEIDVVLVDPSLWDCSAVAVIAQLVRVIPAAKIALTGSHWDLSKILPAIATGVSLVSRSRDGQALTAALCDIHRGHRVLDVQRAGDASASLGPVRLTDRERAVLRAAAAGHHAAATASQLHLAEATVKAHLASASRKLGARTKTHAAVLATRLNLLDAVPLGDFGG